MQKPERSSYTPLDFLEWRESGALVLTPKFQRRGVWKNPAKSYLIDTILRGMPVPPIFLRTGQSSDKKKIVREVIDGQQRIAAITDFISGKFTLAKNLGTSYAGKNFEGLTEEQRDTIREYTFTCEVFAGIGDADVLEVFSRLNTYSVPLNAQELRNGRYFGPFKQTAYALAGEHLEFWRHHRIYTEQNIARMLEVELVSELMVVEIDGLQDKKKSLNTFYSRYDEVFPARSLVEERFRGTIDAISTYLHDELGDSEFRRTPIFYSLFCSVFHRMFGMPKQELPTERTGKLTRSDGERLRETVLALSDVIQAVKDPDAHESAPEDLERFVDACMRQTDNIRPRQIRMTEIYTRAFI
jgi:Protein of unknown function DUF262